MSKNYAFTGDVIRLIDKDYNEWWNRYCPEMSEPEWLRKLDSLDCWLSEREKTHKNWYFIVSSILEKDSRFREFERERAE